MRKRFLFLVPILFLSLFFIPGIYAEAEGSLSSGAADDITRQCLYNGFSGQGHALTDGNYGSIWISSRRYGEDSLDIIAPEGSVIGTVYLQWRYPPVPLYIQQLTGNGTWKTLYSTTGDFYAEPLDIPQLTAVRLVVHDAPDSHIALGEIHVYSPGQLPDTVQHWELPGNKVDMILISGHPDDEVLWFGGMLPYYAAIRDKNILVICASMNVSSRKLELLDCLWTCGIRTQPVFCLLYDTCPRNINQLWNAWGTKEYCLERFTEYYRRYRPDVVVLHDINGEYGHTVHKACSVLGRECAILAADPEAYPDQIAKYGVWDIPKVYVHLYPEEQISMDWWEPQECFGGQTSQDIARLAFLCHRSQLSKTWWKVEDHGLYDNALFGLYRTTVGPDIAKNDFFEHIPQ